MLTQLFVGAESNAIPMDLSPLHKGDVVSFSMSAAKRLLTKSHAGMQFIVEQAERRIGEKRGGDIDASDGVPLPGDRVENR